MPRSGADKQEALSARLAAEFGDIHTVHRLDQATSGLMVSAWNGGDAESTPSWLMRLMMPTSELTFTQPLTDEHLSYHNAATFAR